MERDMITVLWDWFSIVPCHPLWPLRSWCHCDSCSWVICLYSGVAVNFVSLFTYSEALLHCVQVWFCFLCLSFVCFWCWLLDFFPPHFESSSLSSVLRQEIFKCHLSRHILSFIIPIRGALYLFIQFSLFLMFSSFLPLYLSIFNPTVHQLTIQ